MDLKTIKDIELPDDIFDARFHPTKEDLVAAATIGGSLYLIEKGKIKTTLRKHHKGSSIRRVRFDKNGQMITIAKTIKIHDLQTNQTVNTIKRNDENKSAFNAIQPLSTNIICAGDDTGKVFVWDTRSSFGEPVFSSADCEQYISDIDGKYEGKRMFVCTSGEGTLTAYDLRANKMIEPQSELFEAGFQCVKLVDLNKKVVIGGEDGAIYVFNQNEWGHTSGKFAISDDAKNRGKCSIEGIDVISNDSVYLIACSDGKMRSLTLWPHQVLSEKIVCKRRSLECIQVNPIEGKSEVLVGGENYLSLVTYEDKESSEKSDEDEGDESNESEMSASSDEFSEDSDSEENRRTRENSKGKKSVVSKRKKQEQRNSSRSYNPNELNPTETSAKKTKLTNNEDYLNIFN